MVLFLASAAVEGMLSAQKEMSEEEQRIMKLWQEYATPGEFHKYLEYFVGEWDSTSKMWEKPGSQPMVEKQTVVSKMLLDGRYLKSHIKGPMMGMPGEGYMLTSYDNFKKEFMSIWFDNMGTGFYTASGQLDKARKTRTETAVWDDFITGGKSNVKMITKIIDDDNYIFEMYQNDFKAMEMTYKRKK
jgi:hypothetical protein